MSPDPQSPHAGESIPDPPLPTRPGLAIGVLAGGRSRRMGQDKAFLELDGRPMLERVVGELARLQVPLLVAAGKQGRELPKLPAGVRLVHDPSPHEGPMAGMLALLEALPTGCNRIFLCACDLPFMTAQLVSKLDAMLEDEQDMLVPVANGQPQVLAAFYRKSLLAEIAARYSAGDRKLRRLYDDYPTRFLEEEELRRIDPQLLAFHNLNRPEDLEEARRILETSQDQS